jgi:Holliday junction resolvase RusA-like endonuclease
VKLVVRSEVDPGDLGVNIRFRGRQALHPRSRAAMKKLMEDVTKAIESTEGFQPCAVDCSLSIWFTFRNRRFDIDGPIKRTMDSLERAIKAAGYTWNDLRVDHLLVEKQTDPKPGIYIHLT